MEAVALVKVSDVMKSMGIADALESELTVTITSASIKAMFRLEAEIQTRLMPHHVTELFNCDLEPFNGLTPNGFITLRLNNFYISSSNPPVLTFSAQWNGDYEVLPAADVLVDHERGLVFLPPLYDGKFVRVTYYCGFASAFEVPEIIKQAILTYVPSAFQQAQNSTEQAKVDTTDGDKFAGVVVSRLKRNISVSIRPVHSVAEAVDAIP